MTLLAAVVSVLGVAVSVEPGQEATDAAVCQGDAGVCGTVIEIDGVAVRVDCIATGEDDVLNIAAAFVVRFGGEHPGISSDQTLFRLIQIEKGQAEPVDGAGGRSANAVINHEPASGRFDRRWRHANLVGIPPSAAAGFQHEFVAAPMAQVR